jgi:hypothetical protein
MKLLLPFINIVLVLLMVQHRISSQGCVAIRTSGASCLGMSDALESDNSWRLNLSYRYFKSFRHFRGTHEEENRVNDHTDVRNYTHFTDISIVKNINQKWSFGINLPFSATSRSSLYEHDGKTRHTTSSVGLGDIRIAAYRWLINANNRGNVQLGLGIKFATGNYNYGDYFYKELYGPVDQSIQLGDGGTGFYTELNSFIHIHKSLGAYGNFYYLSNPRDENGVSTKRGGTPTANDLKYKTGTMSVPDQYAARIGLTYTLTHFTLSAGLRTEGIPSEDLIGKSNGFRRPGYYIGFEPGIVYRTSTMEFSASVPIALERNRVQSVSDRKRTIDSGSFVQGDAAFADYSINLGMSIRFGNGIKHHKVPVPGETMEK